MNPSIKLSLTSDAAVDFLQDEADGRRRFSGVANSGRPFGHGGVQTVLDFADIRTKPKTAVLIDHDGRRPAGVAALSVAADGSLKADGVLMDNEYGRMVAQMSDEGFPWEMSVFVQAERYEELAAGAQLSVNGHPVTGPLCIMRGCTIREVSFTATGVDANTFAAALSDRPFPSPPLTEQYSMTDEEKQKMADLEAEIARLTQENADLKKANKQEAVKAKLSAAGFKPAASGEGWDGLSPAAYQMLLSAADADLDALIGDFKPKAAAPEMLLSDTDKQPEQQQGRALSAGTLTNTEGKHYV